MKPSNGSGAVESLLTGMAIAQQAELTEDRLEVYSTLLRDIPIPLLKKAILLACNYTKAPVGMLPPVSEIRSFLEQARTELDHEKKPTRLTTPTPAGTPDPHECHPEVAQLREQYEKLPRDRDQKKVRELLGPARGFLANLNAYESLHVKCLGDIHPVCPVCGERWENTFLNPVILQLGKMYPEETKDWNPQHKGFLICSSCKNLTEEV